MAVYDNIPVYVGQNNDDSGSTVVNGDGRFLFTSRCSVRHSVAASKVNRLVGADCNATSNGMTSNGEDKCEIDLEFYLLNVAGNEESYSFLLDSYNGTGENSFPIRVGGNIYKKCFLDDYAVTVRAFEPVKIRAKFNCIDFPKNKTFSNNTKTIKNNYNALMSSNNVVYSYSSTVSGISGQILNSDLITDFSYEKRYNRDIVKPIGTVNGDCITVRSIVEDVELSVSIESTGFKSFMSRGGDRTQSDISFMPRDVVGDLISPTNEDLKFLVPSGTLIINQQYNAEGGNHQVARIELSDTINY